ncbi:class I adenylate-forming enzyme family protein [Longispora albida]|uniref:class I adenylate-forming enzyme family protein n=1 Tax=Longispora albida TaxID=203523 RepID=UPI000379F617|nr:fatty acid--CoA ligase family protein [Longispora albida]
MGERRIMRGNTWEADNAGLVDDLVLAGPGGEPCLRFCSAAGAGHESTMDRTELGAAVAGRQAELAAAGLAPGDVLALKIAPGTGYVVTLLAGWRLGAQVVLLDHRLTEHETSRALDRTKPRLLVTGTGSGGALRAWHDVALRYEARAAGPAATDHVLIQLSSGSTGPSKVIGRTAGSLAAEIARYQLIPGMPARGERIVVLNSLIHAFGLVGGLLHGLSSGVEIVVPELLTPESILTALAGAGNPATLLGVPFHIELLSAVSGAPALPQLRRVITGGEIIRPGLAARFQERYGVPLGECYGMTEVGVIAMDADGAHRPAAGRPAPGVEARIEDGELLVSAPECPYVGEVAEGRWAGGWLRTRDAARIDSEGRVTILGRLDSQISVGGLKVDLTEVEGTLSGLPGVSEAIVVHDRGIEAYVALEPGLTGQAVEAELAGLLAPFKRPRRLHVLAAGLPRTSSGKRIRDHAALRAAAAEGG